ncbi:CapA family protein [Salinibacterium sp. SYSU T00001]|uniref:CapA family protein n=1 Tax=Homoserinimonas sedimenticola TaxID=2986805 RepID=UPI0022364267|nr:CapA family protein [Salinibacterium sedimenticola]MCW4384635.1 CapA family protein [Salinibacterium sedimenticola]
MKRAISIMAVGDLVLDEPDPDFYFQPSAATLQAADLAIAQIEVPHTTSTESASVDVPAPPADPAHVAAAARAGVAVATLAGNHIYDCGPQGIADTIRLCREAGMIPTGAGMTLEEAWEPAVVERGGHRIGVLDVNCVGPRESWATSKKPGSAYVKVVTHYELESANPGGPPTIYSFCDPTSLKGFTDAIARLADEVDVVIVALHKGIGHMPADVAAYEFEIARAAVDAGAHAVIAHHAHIMRGIEVYRGAPIFHGLGNFVTVTSALSSGDENSPERQAWAKRRKKLFGFSPDPAMPTYAFHPESRNTAIAVLEVSDTGAVSGAFIPCWIDDDARPVPHGDDETGRRVADYIENITREIDLDTEFTWDGQLVRVRSPRA